MDAHHRRAHDLVCVSRYIRRYIHVKEGGRMKSRVRISKFSLSTDILIVALKKENEQLKKENAELKAKDEKALRHLKGALGALHGEKQV